MNLNPFRNLGGLTGSPEVLQQRRNETVCVVALRQWAKHRPISDVNKTLPY